MTVEQAIAAAEALLPGSAAAEGEPDPRWQAIIEVGDFIEGDPEAVWSFVCRWGSSEDEDLRMAIATCLLEHLLECHFDRFISRVEEAAHNNVLFAKTVRSCWKFGHPVPQRAARLDRLNASLRERIVIQESRRQAASIAAAVLAGAVSPVVGAIDLNGRRSSLDVPDDDPDFEAFMLIDSECDGLPIGSVRLHWSADALARKTVEVAHAESWAIHVGKQAFENVVKRFASADQQVAAPDDGPPDN